MAAQENELMDDKLYEAARFKGTDVPPQINFLARTLLYENNAIHVAAQYGNFEFTTEAINQLENVKEQYFQHLCQQNSNGETPLHLAAQCGKPNTVECLLRAHDYLVEGIDSDRRKLSWREKDNNGDTPLHKALRIGDDQVAMQLLNYEIEHFPDTKLASVVNNEGESMAYLAAEHSCLKFLDKIFKGYNVEAVSVTGCEGKTVYHAARRLPCKIMRDLIPKIGDTLLKQKDDFGKTVLHYAVEEKRYAMVEELFKNAHRSIGYERDNDGLTPLVIAFKEGLYEAVKIILEFSPKSLECYDTHKRSAALHHAKMDASFLKICRLNIENETLKFLINRVDKDGNTALHIALIKSEPDAAYELLNFHGCNSMSRNKDGLTAWDLCKDNDNIPPRSRLFRQLQMEHQEVENMDDILSKAARVNGAEIPLEINFDSLTLGDHKNALHVASQYGNLTFITAARDQLKSRLSGEYYLHLCHPNSKGETPLHLASQFGHLQIVKELMSMHSYEVEGIDNGNRKYCWMEKDKKGDTPAHKALIHGQDDIAVALLGDHPDSSISQLGSVVNDEGGSLAYLAVENRCSKFINKIFDGDYDPNEVSLSGYKGQTAFHSARRYPDEYMLDLIKKFGTSLLKKQDEFGKTVLHYAVEEKRYAIVEELLKADSSLACLRDKQGLTPLHEAFEKGFYKAVKSILEMCPQSVDVCDEDGKTPLHYTKMDAFFLRKCRLNLEGSVLESLIKGVDKDGNTALHVALIKSEPDAAYELLNFNGCNFKLWNKEGFTPWDLCSTNDNIHYSSSIHMKLRSARHGIHGEPPRCWINTQRNWMYFFYSVIKWIMVDVGDSEKQLDKVGVAGALLLPLNFAAAFNVPGGYDKATGLPILADTVLFYLYKGFNMVAFTLTLLVLLTCTFGVRKHADKQRLSMLSILLLQFSLLFTISAYVCGSISIAPHQLVFFLIYLSVCVVIGVGTVFVYSTYTKMCRSLAYYT